MSGERQTSVLDGGLLLPLFVMVILAVMVVPLPPFLLDLFVTANLMSSVVVLMVALTLLRPIEFTAFPAVLLIATLFRLSLNVASTRLILLGGVNGEAAAGEVIRAFGQFVVGGEPIVGASVFLALIVIQYVVINHGAVRVSEVIARFTLDALPGKQMAVDADLNSGALTDAEARVRRREIAREAEFYGSMDGAVRFSQRDAVAALILMAVNVLAGLGLGVFKHGLEPVEALKLFTVLTIGDGIVAAIPALLISVAGGILTTRAAAEERLGDELVSQVLGLATPLLAASGVLMALALVPGLPLIPFAALSLACAYGGWRARERAREEAEQPEEEEVPTESSSEEPDLAELTSIDPIVVELGFSLLSLVDEASGGDLLGRVKTVRRQVSEELGLPVPAIRIRDKVDLASQDYRLRMQDAEVGRGQLMPHSVMAILPVSTKGVPEGIDATDPTFGLPARWLRPSDRDRAVATGCTVVEPEVVLATHLGQVLRREAWRLLGRKETKMILDVVQRETEEEVVPKLLSLGLVQQVMRNLLTEGVSLRDARGVVDAIALGSEQVKGAGELTAFVRIALGPAICSRRLDGTGRLKVFALGPDLEERLRQGEAEHGLDPETWQAVGEALQRAFQSAPDEPDHVVLCSPRARPLLQRVVAKLHPAAAVMSHAEVPDSVSVVRLGEVA
ncbi:MAG: flagellar biosynthesis protein FlhA [Acidobacteriota bacterium]